LENRAQSRIATHGHNSKSRHHNRSQKVRRENQQQEQLNYPKANAWEPPKTQENDDEEQESDDSEKLVSPGPHSSDSEIYSSTDKEATAKSKATHAKDHKKREQEKKKKKEAAKKKK
jgi:hypothetical protein